MAGPFLVSRNGAVISVPPQQVFDYLADMSRHGEWSLETDFRVISPPLEQPGVGSVFRQEKNGVMRGPLIIRGGMGDNPVRVVKTVTITAYEPYHNLVFETRNSYNGLLVSIDKVSFGLQEDAEGTQVTMVSEVEAMVPGGFMGPVYAIRVVRAALRRLLGKRFPDPFSRLTSNPYLSRIKQMMETGKITRRL